MKKNHPEQVASNAVVVRHVIGRLNEVAPDAARTDVLAGIARVEGWIAGDAVGIAELSELARAIHSAANTTVEQTAPERAWSWAGTAVGNLCWMASKQRGWVDGNRSVMDAAVYALTSLMPSGGDEAQHRKNIADRLAVRERLEAMRAAALTELVEGKSRQPEKKRAQPPRLARPAGLARLGTVVRKWLERCNARVDPEARGDELALRELARARGHSVSDALLVFEERYGGLVVAESPSSEGRDWRFGAWVCLDRAIGDEFAARGLVPVGASPNDLHYYLDPTGAAWAFDAIEDSEPAPFAPDGDRMLARIALYNLAFHRRAIGIEGQRGARIADELRLSLIEEASDANWRAWADARRLVIEDASRTLVSGVGTQRLAQTR